jgi:hypothetical protein
MKISILYNIEVLCSNIKQRVCVCVLHFGVAIYIKKGILRQKKKNYGNSKYFTMQKYINLQSNP